MPHAPASVIPPPGNKITRVMLRKHTTQQESTTGVTGRTGTVTPLRSVTQRLATGCAMYATRSIITFGTPATRRSVMGNGQSHAAPILLAVGTCVPALIRYRIICRPFPWKMLVSHRNPCCRFLPLRSLPPRCRRVATGCVRFVCAPILSPHTSVRLPFAQAHGPASSAGFSRVLGLLALSGLLQPLSPLLPQTTLRLRTSLRSPPWRFLTIMALHWGTLVLFPRPRTFTRTPAQQWTRRRPLPHPLPCRSVR